MKKIELLSWEYNRDRKDTNIVNKLNEVINKLNKLIGKE